jgi:hypothetical protein
LQWFRAMGSAKQPALAQKNPATSPTSRDPFGIPPATTARRKASSIGLIAWTVRRSGATGAQVLEMALQQSRAAAADPRPKTIVRALWRIESVGVSAGRHPLDPAPLMTHPVPTPAQPIAHVGWATGVAQRIGFDAAALQRELADTTLESFRGFCWDGIGADLLVHARPSFRVAAHAIGIIGGGAEPPERSGWFARFRSGLTSEEDRLVAHGLGRLVLVTQRSLLSALTEADRLPAEWRPHAVMGISFAFAMVHYADLPMILERSRQIDPGLAASFHDGLIYALVFSEWLGPGLLASWQPRGAFEAELIARARHEAALSVERGHPLPFALAEPSA